MMVMMSSDLMMHQLMSHLSQNSILTWFSSETDKDTVSGMDKNIQLEEPKNQNCYILLKRLVIFKNYTILSTLHFEISISYHLQTPVLSPDHDDLVFNISFNIFQVLLR